MDDFQRRNSSALAMQKPKIIKIKRENSSASLPVNLKF
jgi:hypothetical protein